jgi:hypothetical protein
MTLNLTRAYSNDTVTGRFRYSVPTPPGRVSGSVSTLPLYNDTTTSSTPSAHSAEAPPPSYHTHATHNFDQAPHDSDQSRSYLAHDDYLDGLHGPRFPSYPTAVRQAKDLEERNQAICPGRFCPDDFQRFWNSAPYILFHGCAVIIEEPTFQGILYRVTPEENAISDIISLGTPIVIGSLDSPDVKYIATILRHKEDGMAYIQLDAYTENQASYRWYDPEWPTLLLVIPSRLCRVPSFYSLRLRLFWGSIRYSVGKALPIHTYFSSSICNNYTT